MTPITLTRFHTNPRSYGFADSYRACWQSTPEGSCHSIHGYMNGLMKQMTHFTSEPTAWSFSEWKPLKSANNSSEYWLSATAVVLEYRGKDLPQVAADLHTRASELGYAHILMDSRSRKGEATMTIVFPLTERVNKDQYARLAAVLSEELGQYRAAEGNMAATHLIHVDERCQQAVIEGAIIAPRAKIKETEKLYQSFDPRRFEAAGPVAGVQIGQPTFTSHDGLFEWSTTDEERAAMDADQLLRSIGADLTPYGELLSE